MDAIIGALYSKNKSRSFLFHGPTGTGKTSAARFCALMINCQNSDGHNPCLKCDSCKGTLNRDQQLVRELNMADKTGVDVTRAELAKINTPPFRKGDKKILILDEAQQMTNAAQQAWLKTLEEPPEWAYIFLCTTEPENFIATVVNRLSPFQFFTLTREDGIKFILDIAFNEELSIDEDLAGRLFDAIGGSHRELIVAIEQVKLEGSDAIAGMLRKESKQGVSIKNFIQGIRQNVSLAWQIDAYYDLINQFDGKTEPFRRAVGTYVEKSIRGEARKEKQSNIATIESLARVLKVVSEPIDPLTPWTFIPRLIAIRSK